MATDGRRRVLRVAGGGLGRASCRASAFVVLALAAQAWAGPGSGGRLDAGESNDLAPIERARGVHDLRGADAGPVTLVAKARLLNLVGGDRDLDYALVVYGPGHWFQRVATGGHIEFRGRIPGTEWRRRPASKKSYRLAEAEMLLDPTVHLRLAPGATVRKHWREAIGEVAAECLEVGPLADYWQHDVSDTEHLPEVALDAHQTVRLCFAPDSGMLVRADYGGSFPRFEYSGLVALGAKQIPRSMRCFEQKKLVVEAEVTNLAPSEAAGPDVDALPDDVETWPACDHPTLPRLISKKPVKHYSEAKARRQFGQLVCHAEVSTGGNLHDLAYVDDGAKPYLVAAINLAIDEWVYEPATCDGKPVPFELYLTVQFPPR